MLINGCPDYDREGKKYKTCMIIGRASRDGVGEQSQKGNFWAKVNVVAYTNKDGSAAFLEVKSFSSYAYPISNVKKGDMIIAAGKLSERQWEGKTYVSLFADFFQNLTEKNVQERNQRQESNLNQLQDTLEKFQEPQFTEISDDLTGELPF